MKKTFFSICLYVISCAGVTNAAMSYLDNGVVKIGVDTAKGATITYFSESGSTRNVINSSDPGRMVQQSYYSGPVPFMGGYYNNSDWGWNPVEAGDTNNKVSTVLDHSNDGTTIYTKVIPKQWALNNVDSECTMEKWITLNGDVAHVTCKLVVFRTDSTQQYAALHQELPAVYGTDDLYRIYTYRGTVPFTGGSAELVSSGTQFPWMYLDATEHWMAAVDGTDWGVGVFTPSAQMAVLGFYGTPKMTPPGNPTGTSTSYLAPIRYEVLDHNITYEYDFYLILGNLADIRNFAYAHQPNKKPDYFFTQDRQGWYYKEGVSDTGFPINGHLRVRTPSSDPYMVGPETVWLGSEVPKLYIRARYNTTDTNAKSIGKASAVWGGLSIRPNPLLSLPTISGAPTKWTCRRFRDTAAAESGSYGLIPSAAAAPASMSMWPLSPPTTRYRLSQRLSPTPTPPLTSEPNMLNNWRRPELHRPPGRFCKGLRGCRLTATPVI